MCDTVGPGVGLLVGARVGAGVGLKVGARVGAGVGLKVGATVIPEITSYNVSVPDVVKVKPTTSVM